MTTIQRFPELGALRAVDAASAADGRRRPGPCFPALGRMRLRFLFRHRPRIGLLRLRATLQQQATARRNGTG
jgi:hypothetical protein